MKWFNLLFLFLAFNFSLIGQDNLKTVDQVDLVNGSRFFGHAYYNSIKDNWTIHFLNGDSLTVAAKQVKKIRQEFISNSAGSKLRPERNNLKFRHNISLEYITPGVSNNFFTDEDCLQIIYHPVYKFLSNLSAGPVLGLQGGYIYNSSAPHILLGVGSSWDITGIQWIPFMSAHAGYNYFLSDNDIYDNYKQKGGVFLNPSAGIQYKLTSGTRLWLSAGISYQQVKEKAAYNWQEFELRRNHELLRYIFKFGIQL